MNGVRFEAIDDIEYMVTPVVAVMEIVLNGILLPAKEIGRFPDTWNGVPVPVGHPFDADGWAVSAKTIDRIFKSVGWLFSVAIDVKDQHKLRGEIWFDIQRAVAMGGDPERAYSQIRNGYQAEVSSAFYADIEQTSGTFDGTEYLGIFRNIVPDHVAILLDEKGACNREDGCGVPQVNVDDDNNTDNNTDNTSNLHIGNQTAARLSRSQKEKNMDRESIIQALIACECCTLDRSALEALPDDALVAMAAMRDSFIQLRANAQAAAESNNDVADTEADEDEDADEDEENTDDTTASTPITEALAKVNAFMNKWGEVLEGLRQNGDDEKKDLITRIVASSNLEPAMLEGLDTDALTILETDLAPANYGGRAVRAQTATGKSTRMKMPSIDEVE